MIRKIKVNVCTKFMYIYIWPWLVLVKHSYQFMQSNFWDLALPEFYNTFYLFRHMHGCSDHQSLICSNPFKKKNMILYYKTFDLSSQKDVVCSVWLILAGCKFGSWGEIKNRASLQTDVQTDGRRTCDLKSSLRRDRKSVV